MSAFINTNIASLNAQRNLTMSQSSLQTSIQRLSSGLRINSSKDDAAGLAIAARFTTQINGLDQASRNANDGISLAQTADGALASVSDNLQRIRQLAVQAANSTNSSSDRAAINQEVQQRLAEIDRSTSQASFNGQKVLDGSFGTASFQVGANAGETISVSLGTSMRTNSIGTIASATTAGTVGAAGSGGTYGVTASNFDFSVAGSAATAGHVAFNATNLDYSSVTNAGSNGTLDFTAAAFNFSSGTNTAGVDLSATDFSGGAGNVAQFDVQVGSTTVGITLNANYTDNDGVAAAIQSQINAVAGLENVTVTNGSGANDGKLTFTNVGGSDAVQIKNADTNAGTAGISNDAGTAGTAQPDAEFKIDGQQISLTGDYTNAAGLATEIQNQIQAYGGAFAAYTVTANGNVLTIDNGDNGGAAVAITNANSSANQGGVTNATGTAGVAATTDGSAHFTVDAAGDNIAVTLDQNYASYDDLASAIGTQLGANYTVTNAGSGSITIERATTGSGSTAVDLSAGDANADAAGFTAAGVRAGQAGTNKVDSTNATFQVDGHTVTLDQNYTNAAGLRTALASQLSGYTIGGTGNAITFTNNTNGSAAVALTNADPNAFNAGFVNGTGTAGVSGGTVTLTDFSIKAGDNAAVSLNGTYDSVDDLAAEINKSVQGAFAKVSGGKLVLTSSADMVLGGTDATGTLGFAAASVTASSGSLNNVDTLSVDGANDAIQRVDSALTAVNGLRSTFGAIQNRFESVISNLASTNENLSAARSRIQDADFASETANMTRAQILQQAGTAMLAQANSLPNGVLALLR